MKEYTIDSNILDFIEDNGTIACEDKDNKYAFFPFWIERTGKNKTKLHKLENLPPKLQNLINSQRNREKLGL